MLNGWWRRQRYDHAGQPVFKASGHFLYFRPALTTDAEPQKDPISRSSGASGLSAAEPAHENEIADGGGGDGGDMGGRWVIDKAIRVGGVPVSASLTSDIQGRWQNFVNLTQLPWVTYRVRSIS